MCFFFFFHFLGAPPPDLLHEEPACVVFSSLSLRLPLNARAHCLTARERGEGKGSTLGARYAYEAPDVMAARSKAPKVTACDGTNQVYCVSHSHLKRTAHLSGIMQWMGLANDMSDPSFVPPSDAEIIMAYFSKMMAKQRWQRAGNALGALRAMKLAGGGALGGLLKSPPPAAAPPAEETPSKRQPRHSQMAMETKEQGEKTNENPPDSPTDSPVHPRSSVSTPARGPRMSVSFVKGNSGANSIVKRSMGQLPKPHDMREFLRELRGPFCFAILETRKEFILAGCSADCETQMLASVAPDGTMFFGTDPDVMPPNCTIVEVPKGTYFCGRYNGNGDEDLVFKKFAKVAPEDQE